MNKRRLIILLVYFCLPGWTGAQQNLWVEAAISLERGFYSQRDLGLFDKGNYQDFSFPFNSRFSVAFLYGLNKHHYLKGGIQVTQTSYAFRWKDIGWLPTHPKDATQVREVETINLFLFPMGYRLDFDHSDLEPFIELGALSGIFIRSAHKQANSNGEVKINHRRFVKDNGVPLFLGMYAALGWNIFLNENLEVFFSPAVWLNKQWKNEHASRRLFFNYGLNLGARYQIFKVEKPDLKL